MSGEIKDTEKTGRETGPEAGRLRAFISDFGWPRLIIFFFVVLLFIAAPFVKVRVDSSLMNIFVRFGQNGVMVLALVPMMQAGAGLNFGLPVDSGGASRFNVGDAIRAYRGRRLFRRDTPQPPLRPCLRLALRPPPQQGKG